MSSIPLESVAIKLMRGSWTFARTTGDRYNSFSNSSTVMSMVRRMLRKVPHSDVTALLAGLSIVPSQQQVIARVRFRDRRAPSSEIERSTSTDAQLTFEGIGVIMMSWRPRGRHMHFEYRPLKKCYLPNEAKYLRKYVGLLKRHHPRAFTELYRGTVVRRMVRKLTH